MYYGHSHLRDHNMQFLDFIGYYKIDNSTKVRNHVSWARNITSPEGYSFHITFIFVGLLPPEDHHSFARLKPKYDIAYVAIGAWNLLYGNMGYDIVMQKLSLSFEDFRVHYGRRADQIVVYNLHYMHTHCDMSHRLHGQFRACLHHKRQETFRKMILCTAMRKLPQERTWLWDVTSLTRSTYARLDTSLDRHHYIQNSRVMNEILQLWADGTERVLESSSSSASSELTKWPKLRDIAIQEGSCVPERYPCDFSCWCNRYHSSLDSRVGVMCKEQKDKIRQNHKLMYKCPAKY
eukprot:PhF_6_TR31397/c0_g1_i3/m.45993